MHPCGQMCRPGLHGGGESPGMGQRGRGWRVLEVPGGMGGGSVDVEKEPMRGVGALVIIFLVIYGTPKVRDAVKRGCRGISGILDEIGWVGCVSMSTPRHQGRCGHLLTSLAFSMGHCGRGKE
jgi:hypothetical protein